MAGEAASATDGVAAKSGSSPEAAKASPVLKAAEYDRTVMAAIKNITERSYIPRRFISKYILEHYNVGDPKVAAKRINASLNKLLKTKRLSNGGEPGGKRGYGFRITSEEERKGQPGRKPAAAAAPKSTVEL